MVKQDPAAVLLKRMSWCLLRHRPQLFCMPLLSFSALVALLAHLDAMPVVADQVNWLFLAHVLGGFMLLYVVWAFLDACLLMAIGRAMQGHAACLWPAMASVWQKKGPLLRWVYYTMRYTRCWWIQRKRGLLWIMLKDRTPSQLLQPTGPLLTVEPAVIANHMGLRIVAAGRWLLFSLLGLFVIAALGLVFKFSTDVWLYVFVCYGLYLGITLVVLMLRLSCQLVLVEFYVKPGLSHEACQQLEKKLERQISGGA